MESESLTAVETYMIQNHIKTRKGKDFSRFSIKGILRNPVYMIADSDAWEYLSVLGAEIFAEKQILTEIAALWHIIRLYRRRERLIKSGI